jgi:hypothetical protein
MMQERAGPIGSAFSFGRSVWETESFPALRFWQYIAAWLGFGKQQTDYQGHQDFGVP